MRSIRYSLVHSLREVRFFVCLKRRYVWLLKRIFLYSSSSAHFLQNSKHKNNLLGHIYWLTWRPGDLAVSCSLKYYNLHKICINVLKKAFFLARSSFLFFHLMVRPGDLATWPPGRFRQVGLFSTWRSTHRQVGSSSTDLADLAVLSRTQHILYTIFFCFTSL